MLQIRLLGQFNVQRDGAPIAISSRQAQSLFSFLLLNPTTAHRREKLAGLLWPNASDTNSRNNLRRELWRLRQALETRAPRQRAVSYFVVDEIAIAFDATADFWLDAAFLQRTTETTTNDLIESLDGYRGELLPGFYDEWVVLERERLRAVFEQKMARLLDLLITEERWRETVEWGERWIASGQTPEPAYRALMTAHSALGDVAQVAKVFERCAQALRNDLGVEPSEQTRALYEKLKLGKQSQVVSPIPKIVPARRVAHLPTPLTSFIGREKELKEIAGLLSSSRLLTLTGSGGIGKTRLAIQTAHDSLKNFRDGVFWVDLVGLADANLIPQEIAQSLTVREVPGVPLIETLKVDLASKYVLLILDNCEHLIETVAQTVEQLLGACPNLKILATSRERLGIFNEIVWRVPSLNENTSRQLFGERARAAQHDIALTGASEAFIAQICERLDGIPLAIELAAARVAILSPEEIAHRLDDRFALLASGSRTALPRQQTLRAAIDWSHELLTEPERVLFRRLAVFAGGFTLQAAETVCGAGELMSNAILDLLARLTDKSLVIVERETVTGETRYRLLETIRQYALEKLAEPGETASMQDRHLDFYLHLAEKSEPNIFSSESALWFSRLDRELENIRAAIEWGTQSGKAVVSLQILGSLVYFWFAHGLVGSEWHERVQQALSRPEGRERSLARAKALNGLGFMYWADIYPADRRPELEEALSMGPELGDQWNTATALRNLGLIENINGNYVHARMLLEQSLVLWRKMGPEGKTGSAWTLIFLGDVALNYYEADWARSLYEESIKILKEPGDINFLAYCFRRLGQLLWREGSCDQARLLCNESLKLNQQVGDPRGKIACLAGFAGINVTEGNLERAAKLMGAIDSQLTLIGVRLLYIDKLEYERNLVIVKNNMDNDTLAAHWSQGKTMTMEQAIAFALE